MQAYPRQMFEHMKNYDHLLHKISTWLKRSASKPGQISNSNGLQPSDSSLTGGQAEGENTDPSLLFVHIFCHKSQVYDFEDDDGWMAQTFFSGLLISPLLIPTLSFTDLIHPLSNHITTMNRWNDALPRFTRLLPIRPHFT